MLTYAKAVSRSVRAGLANTRLPRALHDLTEVPAWFALLAQRLGVRRQSEASTALSHAPKDSNAAVLTYAKAASRSVRAGLANRLPRALHDLAEIANPAHLREASSCTRHRNVVTSEPARGQIQKFPGANICEQFKRFSVWLVLPGSS